MFSLASLKKTVFNEQLKDGDRVDAALELIDHNYPDENFEFIEKITPLILMSDRIDAWIILLSHPLFPMTALETFSYRFDPENLNAIFDLLKKHKEDIIINTMKTLSSLKDMNNILNFCLLGLVDYFSFETISKVIDALPPEIVDSIVTPSAETEIDPYFDLFFLKHIVTADPENWVNYLERAIQNVVNIRVEYLDPGMKDKTQELTQHFITPAAIYHADYLMMPVPADGDTSRASSVRITSTRRSVNSVARNRFSQELAAYMILQEQKMGDLVRQQEPVTTAASAEEPSAVTPLPEALVSQPPKPIPQKGLLGQISSFMRGASIKAPPKPPKPK